MNISNKFKRSYIITLFSSSVLIILNISLFKLAASKLGPDGFAEYNIIRRYISLLLPIVLLGFGVAVPRMIAKSKDIINVKYYYYYAIIVFSIIFIFWGVVSIEFKSTFSQILFGTSSRDRIIIPFTIWLFALGIHSMNYAYYHGVFNMRIANTIAVLSMGIIPLVPFLFPLNDIFNVILLTSIILLFFSLAIMFYLLSGMKFHTKQMRKYGKELIVFGSGRVPGHFALAGLLTFPSFFAVHFVDLKTAGYIAFGNTIVTLLSSLFNPISTVLLPYASNHARDNETEKLNSELFLMLKIVLVIVVISVIITWIILPPLIVWYLGEEYRESIGLLRTILPIAISYSIFITIRSVNESMEKRPVNSINLIYSLFLCVFLSLLVWIMFNNFYYVLVVYNFSFVLLAVLSYLSMLKILKKNDHSL